MSDGFFGRMARQWWPMLAAAAVIFALGMPGCRDSEPPGGQGITWQTYEEEPGLQYARLQVPLDYTRPGGTRISIALIKWPASGPAKRIGPLLINPGGPGASGFDAVVNLSKGASDNLPGRLNERFDIIGFDPRGVGKSTRVRSSESLDGFIQPDPLPKTPAETQALLSSAKKMADDTALNSSTLLPFVDTASVARDIDAIRVALGEEKISFIGMSYGTYLGAVYADLFPERVRAFVLDGVSGAADPNVIGYNFVLTQAVKYNEFLKARLDASSQNPLSPFHSGGDAVKAFDALKVAVSAGELKGEAGRTVTPGEFNYALSIMMQSPPNKSAWGTGESGDLEMMLALAAEGDGSAILQVSDLGTGRREGGIYPDGGVLTPTVAVLSADGMGITTMDELDKLFQALPQQAPRIQPVSVILSKASPFWTTPPKRPALRPTAHGTPAILLIGITRDPATPYEWAQSLSSQLENAILLTLNGDGHIAFYQNNKHIDQYIFDYLVNLETPAPGTIIEAGD